MPYRLNECMKDMYEYFYISMHNTLFRSAFQIMMANGDCAIIYYDDVGSSAENVRYIRDN